MPRDQKKRKHNIKQKQFCSKVNKDFKSYPHQKKYVKKLKVYSEVCSNEEPGAMCHRSYAFKSSGYVSTVVHFGV